jgi:hypothetical protein
VKGALWFVFDVPAAMLPAWLLISFLIYRTVS